MDVELLGERGSWWGQIWQPYWCLAPALLATLGHACLTCGPCLATQAYLATDSEAEDGEHGGIEGEADEEDEEAIRERYRRLLLGGGVDAAQERQGKRDWGGGSGDDEGSEGSSGSDSEGQDAGRTRINDDKGGCACCCWFSVQLHGSNSIQGRAAHLPASCAPAHPPAYPGSSGMEMEVTFLPGLENLGKRVLARKQEEEARKGETVWDAYMRRRR